MSDFANYFAPQPAKRKVFISYYHADDQSYKEALEKGYGGSFISKSVGIGDINTDVSTEYVKQLIQNDYLRDASVLMVLCGPNTKGRKHVDWEISGALSQKVGGKSGLVGVLLPTFPLDHEGKYNYDDIPARLADNVKNGYAKVYLWNYIAQSQANFKNVIDTAYSNRIFQSENSRLQAQRNTLGI